MEHSVDGSVFDSNGPSLSDVINDEGLWGNAYLNPSYVEYGWQLSISDYVSHDMHDDE